MAAIGQWTRWVFLAYFISHIPITLMFDLQAILPAAWYPLPLRQMVREYALAVRDPFMLGDEIMPWFNSFVTCEALFQFPFFFVAVWGFWTRSNAIRIPSIIYGSHVSTTVVCILYHLFLTEYPADVIGPRNLTEKLVLAAIYMPYLALPLWLTWVMARHEAPFGSLTKKSN